MGAVCSLGKKHSAVNSADILGIDSKNADNVHPQYSISASIICSAIWNPFRVSREEAEILLQDAFPGAYIFSHNITSEIFLSMSTGKYVCHHPVLKYEQRYHIGGRDFKNIQEAITFYRRNPLGDAVLTEQFNSAHNEERTDTKQSPSSSSPPTKPKSKTKRVTFEPTPKSSKKSVTINNQPTVISSDMTLKTTHTALEDELTSEQNEEMFKKMANKPRKSICRVQPEDSLSTTSGNMFKEEEF